MDQIKMPIGNCKCPICKTRKAEIYWGSIADQNNTKIINTTPTSERLVRLNKTWKR